MNIDSIADVVAESEKPATRVILMPNKEPYRNTAGKECTIGALGSESAAYKKAREEIQRRALRRRQAFTPKEILQNRIDLAAAVMTADGWFGWEAGPKNEPLAFSLDAARKLLSYEHILVQAEELRDEHADFLAAKSTG